MRILAVSDMHGEIRIARQLADELHPDLILCAGDWGDPGEVSKDAIGEVLRRAPVLTVFGNHDDLELLPQITNADGRPILLAPGEVRNLGGLGFAGISGIWAKSHRMPYYVTDEDVRSAAENLAGKPVDILITHGCPVGLSDLTPAGTHGGQRCFLEAAKLLQPRLHLCGHLHRQSLRRLKDGRIFANVGSTAAGDYLLIEAEPDQPAVKWQVIASTHHA